MADAGLECGLVYGKRGASYVEQKAAGFARASAGNPTLALVDLMDTRRTCAPSAASACVSTPPSTFLMRVVVREIESWLLADREGLAKHLGVRVARLPENPESLADPKQCLINVARKSPRRAVREQIVPLLGSGAREGPSYNARLGLFVRDEWSPAGAEALAPSLHRCRRAVRALARRLRSGE